MDSSGLYINVFMYVAVKEKVLIWGGTWRNWKEEREGNDNNFILIKNVESKQRIPDIDHMPLHTCIHMQTYTTHIKHCWLWWLGKWKEGICIISLVIMEVSMEDLQKTKIVLIWSSYTTGYMIKWYLQCSVIGNIYCSQITGSACVFISGWVDDWVFI